MWNHLRSFTPKARLILLVIIDVLVVITVACCFYLVIFPALGINQSNLTPTVYVASFSLIVSLCGILFTFSTRYHQGFLSSKYQIGLSCAVDDDKVTITSSIENKGKTRIIPKQFFLFIDEGKEGNEKGITTFLFPPLTQHENKEEFCPISKLCRLGGLKKHPDYLIQEEYNEQIHSVIELKLLNPKGILFVDPGELFSEDITLKLKQGIYRAVLIGIFGKNGCVCANKHFIIKN